MVEKVMNKETRRIGKRTLAMFMAIVMCLSLLPMNVLASSDAVELAVGETVQLPGIAWSDNEKHEWHVEDESIVSINGGYVTGLKAGETTVTHVYYEEIMDEVPVIEEPVIDEPIVEEPVVEEPVVEEPIVEEPIVEEPVVEEPVVEEPVVEEPVVEEPVVEEPAVEEPVVEEPVVEEPVVEEPVAEEPVVEEPVVEEPVVEEPVVEEPADEEPEVIDLGTESLIVNSPAEEPAVEEPVVEEPVVEEPVVEEPVVEEPIVEEPVVEEPVVEEPVVEEPVVKEPVIVEIDGYERREESWTVIVTDPGAITGEATYEGVTVTVNAPYGAFPEGTELNIAPVAKEEPTLGEQIFNFFDKLFGNAAEMAEAEEIEDPMEAVRSLLTETFEEIEEESNMVAFDITFTDPASGEELQPADGKTVDVQFTVDEDSALLADGPAALQVYHVHEDAVETIGEEVLAVPGEDVTLAVEAEAFSVYIVSTLGSTSGAQELTGTYTMKVGETLYVYASNAESDKGSWNSSDSAIATVERYKENNRRYATITAVAPGTVTISYSRNDEVRDSATILVEVPEGYVPVTVNVKYNESSLSGATVTLTDEDGNTYTGTSNSSGVATIYIPAYGTFDASATYSSTGNGGGTYGYTGELSFSAEDTSETISLTGVTSYNHIDVKTTAANTDGSPVMTVSSVVDSKVYYTVNGTTYSGGLNSTASGGEFANSGHLSTNATSNSEVYLSVVMSDGKTYNVTLTKDSVYPNNTYYPITGDGASKVGTYFGISAVEGKGYNISGKSVFLISQICCNGSSVQSKGSLSGGGLDLVLNIATILQNATNVVDGAKTLAGGQLTAEQFSFVITKTDSSWQPLTGDDAYTQTVKNGTAGTIDLFMFSALEYSAAGTYYYTVAEVNDGAAGYVYDDTVYRVKHEVEAITTGSGTQTATKSFRVTETITKVVDGTESAAEEITFANTYNPAGSLKVNKTVTVDGQAPAGDYSVDVNVYAADNLQTSLFSATLNAENSWTHTFPTVEAGSYKVVETVTGAPSADDYTVSEEGSENVTVVSGETAEVTLVNTYISKISVPVTKVWADANNQDGKRPASVTVKLLADNVDTGKTLVLSDTNSWSGSFTKLERNNANGVAIAYTVDETSVPTGYSKNITGNMTDGYTITNSYTPEQTSVSVAKVWDDADNQDGIRPASVTVQLKANGTASGAAVTLNEANDWSYTWPNLAKKAAGQDIVYTVDETAVPDGYTKNITGNAANGFTITNSHTPAVTSVRVTKVWDDADNQDGIRPASVAVQLYADGEAVGTPVTLPSSLTYTWSELPKFAAGQEIRYTVAEAEVPEGYVDAVTGSMTDGYTITNTHKPAKTEVTVTKVWDDNSDEGVIRPASISVQLYANSAASGDPVALSASNGWTYTWEDLDEFANGQTIAYTVDETSVPTGYEKTSVTGSASNGYTITNTLKRGDFAVVKVDAANASNKLAGAVFTLTNNADSSKVYEVTSNASGEADFENIPYGTYTLVETTEPTDYVKSETEWTVVIGDGSVTIEEKVTAAQKLVSFFAADNKDFAISGSTLTVENTHQTGVITVEKIAKEDSADIGGSYTFGIYTLSGDNTFTKVDDVTVAGNGSSQSDALDTQITYYVRETALAPSGLSKAVENYNVATSYNRTDAQSITGADGYKYVEIGSLTTSGLSVTCTNVYTLKTGSLTVKKLVEDTETTEAFTIQVKLGNGSVAASGTEYVANGLYTFNLKHNETAAITGIPYTTAYAVTEQYTEPFGYVVTYSNATGSISEAAAEAAVTNSYVTSGFVVNKIDKDSKAGLPGAEFTLYSSYDVSDASKNVVYGTYTTGEGGSLSISNLPAGTYWLKETDAPANYDITDDTVWRITVSASQTENTGAAIKVEKDNTGKNFVATLYNTIVSFFGTKTYTVDPVTIQTAETEEEQTAVLTVENTLIDYSLTISKSVSGTTTDRTYKFNVYAADANGEKGALIAGNVAVTAGASVTLSNKPAGSEVSAPALVAGTYIVEEVTSDVAVANYTWTGVDFDAVTEGNQTSGTAVLTEAQRSDSVAAVNTYTRDMATLVVNKTYSGPADLASNFQITVTDGTTPMTVGLTNATKNQDGSYTWSFNVMTNVAYSVSESNTAVENWTLDPQNSTVSGSATVTEKNGSATVNLINAYTRNQGTLTIVKEIGGILDKTSVGSTTFAFEVKNADGETVKTVTLPNNGSWSASVQVDDAEDYTVVETSGAISGYVWTVKNGQSDITANKSIAAEVPAGGSASVTFTNEYQKDFNDGSDVIIGDSFSISKIDNSNNPLSGARFVLTDESGSKVWEGESNAKGAVAVVIENSDISNAKAENGAKKTFTLTETAPEGYVGAGPWTVTLTCDKEESEQQAAAGKFYHIYTWTVESVKLKDSDENLLANGDVEIMNTLIEGTITVNKIVDGLPESMKSENSYTFNVYNAEKSLVDTLTVNAGSKWAATTKSLPYGEYTIEETNPEGETGYTWSGVSFDGTAESKKTVSIASQGQQIAVNATNTYTRDLGSLTVSKAVVIDALAADLVSGKTYELTISGPADANGKYSDVVFENGVATVTLSDKGSVTIENLPTGDYVVTESKAAEAEGLILSVAGKINNTAVVADKNEGFKLPAVSVSKGAASTVAVTNTYTLDSDQDTARFVISKKNSDTNDAIAGVTFTLYADEKCTKAVDGMTKVTDDQGMAEFVLGDELLNGESATFYLKETVPAGYVDNGTVWEIKIDKADANSEYKVTLAQAPEGLFYKLYHWFVSIVNEGAIWKQDTLVISNEPIDYTINVVKVDENGAALAGSAFKLNNIAMEAVSGSDNQFTASVNYTVTPELTISESTVPTGYTGVADFGLEFVVEEGVVTNLIETEDSEAVTIEKNGDVYTVTVMNTRRPDGPDAIDDTAEFTISKVETNNTENGLAGAKFALLTADEYKKYQADETYTALRTVTSGDDGKVEIAELVTVGDEAESTYYLVETAAPTGFSADSSVWTVIVTKEAEEPRYEPEDDAVNGEWIVHKSYEVTDIQLNGQSVKTTENAKSVVEISNTRNSYTVTVTKRFSGRAALPESFAIVNSYDEKTVFTVANAASGDGIETPYTWSMEIPFDTEVTFTEQGYDDEATSGYSVVAVIADNSGENTTDGIVTIPANSDTTVAFTNTYEMVFDPAGDDVNGSDFSISKTGDYEDGFLAGAEFTLTDENGKAVWTGTTTSEGVLDVTIEGADVVDPKEINAEGETIRTYTLTEKAPVGYTGAGPWTVTISGKESISEDLKDNKFYHIYDWTVESVTLADSEENLLADGVVSILNTRDYGTLAITKVVKGLVGAEAKAEHTFSINVTNDAEIAGTYDISVAGNDSASYAETITLPTGAYTVKELEAMVDEHSGPAVTWKVNDEAAEAENGEIVIEIVKDAETAVEVTNEYSYDPAQHTVTVNVVKVWKDDNDRDGIRPDSIRVELKDAEGTVIGTEDIGADGTATFEFDPYYNEYKKDYVVTEIGYTMNGEYVEGKIPGYTAEVDGYTVTNTHEIETVDIYVEKTWKSPGKKEVTFRLLADGVKVDSMVLDGEIDEIETEKWKGAFENLPKNSAGEAIVYTLTEDDLGSQWRYEVEKVVAENGDVTFQVKNYRDYGDSEEEEEPPVVIPDIEPPTTDIPEEEVPTAEPPKTSDSMIVWVLAAAVSGLGLVWLALSGKKREEEEESV